MGVIRDRFAAATWTRWAKIYNVTLTHGKVIRWRDYLTREQALAAAGANDPH